MCMFTCNSTYSPPRLYFDTGMHIEDLSVEEGTISVRTNEAFDCYNKSGKARSSDQIIRLREGPFRFSDTRNKFTAVGCDALAFMTDAEGTFLSGCFSICNENNTMLEGSCSGIGCCQTAVPKGLKTLTLVMRSEEKTNIIQKFLSSLENKNLSEILCFNVTDEEMEEIGVFAELAKRCLSNSGVNRPTMKDVTEELGRLMKLHQSLWAQQNSKETENLLGDDSSSYLPIEIETTKMKQPDTYTLNMTTFDF
ncbi:hypothetical protein GH714_012621 [Hevea brasiliensis]|uniref:Wall-associated receptor kinase galacturonan-binding domain-containing protein n=1 Tax=Hevea brasiliensis TaxID=3981 RepID=A0A6A6N9N8_HEVBR|nr:hypothetical protein GH714_012621 [Hevea brasiliensis]